MAYGKPNTWSQKVMMANLFVVPYMGKPNKRFKKNYMTHSCNSDEMSMYRHRALQSASGLMSGLLSIA